MVWSAAKTSMARVSWITRGDHHPALNSSLSPAARKGAPTLRATCP